MEDFAPVDWGDHQQPQAEQASPGSGGVQQSPVIHYDNPLFDAEDQDVDYHNEPLRFRSMTDLIRPAVPPGQVPRELSTNESDRLCRSGFMTLPPALLQEQPVVVLCWIGLTSLGC
jgi:hypothetical protein